MTETFDLTQTLFERFPREVGTKPVDTALAWLENEGVMNISGPDAAKFLQGQVTCDVARLEPGISTLGARCNPKGRMQSSFRLLKTGDTDFLLCLDGELLQQQLKELSKYAVFFKAELKDVSPEWVRLGLWGTKAQAALEAAGFSLPGRTNDVVFAEAGLAVRLSEDAFELWVPSGKAVELVDTLGTLAEPVNIEAWTVRQIRAGLGQVTAPTYESFIPQMLNLQQVGGVSFRKGCYTGQEIVARMQYLGKLKRRMYRLLLAGEVTPPAGSPIVERDSGKPVGEVVLAARSSRMVEILAVMQKDAAQSTLSVADSSGPLLTLADLPYESELAASEADTEN